MAGGGFFLAMTMAVIFSRLGYYTTGRSNTAASLAFAAAAGTVLVTGTGSTWNIDEELNVGVEGTGTLVDGSFRVPQLNKTFTEVSADIGCQVASHRRGREPRMLARFSSARAAETQRLAAELREARTVVDNP